MSNKLIIVGNTSFADIAFEYFSFDSDYEIVAFSVEKNFIREATLHNLPVVAFEEIENKFDSKEHSVFVASTYTSLNRLRTRLVIDSKKKGFKLASYVSSKSFLWQNVELGEHCFIFEDNTIQPFVKIGSNNIIWSGNHIGHHSIIGNNNFISSHVVISGHCNIDNNCFFGVNSTFVNNLEIKDDTIVGSGALMTKNSEKGKVYVGNPARPLNKSSYSTFDIEKNFEMD
jgi:sugar O-acyltransferase (sialic acid O-acetyltransferase NeuD family)